MMYRAKYLYLRYKRRRRITNDVKPVFRLYVRNTILATNIILTEIGTRKAGIYLVNFLNLKE